MPLARALRCSRGASMKDPAALPVLIAILVLGCALTGCYPNSVTSTTTGKASGCLAMAGNTTREEEGLTYIVGTIKNNCDSKFGHVTVTFKLDREPGPTESLPEAIAYGYSR